MRVIFFCAHYRDLHCPRIDRNQISVSVLQVLVNYARSAKEAEEVAQQVRYSVEGAIAIAFLLPITDVFTIA